MLYSKRPDYFGRGRFFVKVFGLLRGDWIYQQFSSGVPKAYERGYFGDNYHDNLLTCFGLCWTRDIYVTLLGKRDEITPAHARQLLRILKEKEPVLAVNLRTVRCVEGMTQAGTVRYYRDKYARLQLFLDEAITLGETIDFSR